MMMRFLLVPLVLILLIAPLVQSEPKLSEDPFILRAFRESDEKSKLRQFRTLDKTFNFDKNRTEKLKAKIVKLYKQVLSEQGKDKILPEPTILVKGEKPEFKAGELKTGEKTMPFYFIGKGKVDEGKRPMFIALHGGGSAGGRAKTPHGWSVNTREWQAQLRLSATVYPNDALYFVPRMADDNDGRWYFKYNQDAYEEVIRQGILFHDVDPNRVYLIGISEGAYTAFILGSFFADRWAGSGSMAGGSDYKKIPPENFRNIAFRADIGEKDTMFNRKGLHDDYKKAMEDLKKKDPEGYNFSINIIPNRGHGIPYKPCPEWIFQFERNPYPNRVAWKIVKSHGRRNDQFYWLAMDEDPAQYPVIINAKLDKNSNSVNVNIEKLTEDKETQIPANEIPFRIYLNEEMLDLDKPVKVVRNGKQVFEGKVSRKFSVMMKSLEERGDPSYMFPCEILIPADI